MADILYLTHRIPYPPDKGDKVRSFHILQHLRRRHRVFLGTFIDDPADRQHLTLLRQWCEDVKAVELNPVCARLTSLRGLLTGEPLSVSHYRHRAMQRWVSALVGRGQIDAAVVFSSAVAPAVLESGCAQPLLMDFVDLDSAKWSAYGSAHGGMRGWVYRREGRLLADHERRVAARAHCSYFVAEQEMRLFQQGATIGGGPAKVMGNGVDAQYFDPAQTLANPFDPGERAIVFTGAMDYWPNIDAVTWFAQSVWPELSARHPDLRFHIVGRSPTPEVLALAGPRVRVTGTVPDIRPYLGHASVVVAPLRLARGIQNKVLEAMAMAVPVVAARTCVQALELTQGDGVRPAESAQDYRQQIESLLNDHEQSAQSGQRARDCVVRRFSWDVHLSILGEDLRTVLTSRRGHPEPQGVTSDPTPVRGA